MERRSESGGQREDLSGRQAERGQREEDRERRSERGHREEVRERCTKRGGELEVDILTRPGNNPIHRTVQRLQLLMITDR